MNFGEMIFGGNDALPGNSVPLMGHTGERAAVLKLHFHEFDEKELLRAEFL